VTDRAPLPVTVLLAVKNEAVNLPRCLESLRRASRVVLLDSQSVDGTPDVAAQYGAEVVQFEYSGGYPKKRQWALENLDIATPWVMFVDADEVVPDALWREIELVIKSPSPAAGYLVEKSFHFLGRRLRFGGFSHAAVILIQFGRARFEHLVDEVCSGLDMEVHERLIVDGPVGRLKGSLVHEDFKGLSAYIDRHNKYSTWEAYVRNSMLSGCGFSGDAVRPRIFGNTQERRRFLKLIAMRIPCEPLLWFLYHYIFRLGFLEGRRGLIAAQVRSSYIAQVRAKMFELRLAPAKRRRRPRGR